MSNPVPDLLALTSIADGSPRNAAPVRNNFSAIQTAINEFVTALSGGSAGDTLVAAGPSAVQWESGSSVPSGALLDYAAATPPSGWLLCDGSAVSRSTYASLFGAIATTYGAGDGSTTFNIPDFRGRVAVGHAASGGHPDVSTLGANDGVAAANRRAKHRHTPHAHAPSNGGVFISGSAQTVQATGSDQGGTTSSPTTTSVDGGSGNANDSLDAPAYIVVNKIIKT